MILSAHFAVNDEKWRFLPHVVPNLPVFGPEPALEGHMNRLFCAYSFLKVLQCMLVPQVRSIDMRGHETIGLLGKKDSSCIFLGPTVTRGTQSVA